MLRKTIKKILKVLLLLLPSAKKKVGLVLQKIRKVFIDTRDGIFGLFIRYSYVLALGILLPVTLLNINQQVKRFPKADLTQAYIGLNAYPLSPFSRAEVAGRYMELGYQEEAASFLEASERELGIFPRKIKELAFGPVREKISVRSQKEKQLVLVLVALQTAPYSESLLLRKAEIEAELFFEEELYDTLSVVSWLDPSFLPEKWLQ